MEGQPGIPADAAPATEQPQQPQRGNYEAGGFRGGRGGPRGRGRGRGGQIEKEKWVPCTKLGRLVEDKKITSIDEIFYNSLKIREYQIVDHFYTPKTAVTPGQQQTLASLDQSGTVLHDTVMRIAPVQKATRAGTRTRFRAHVLVGNCKGHVGIGTKAAKEVATAIRGAIVSAKLNLVPVRRGFWGSSEIANTGAGHTLPMKLSGSCGSVRVRLIPAPRGTGIIGSNITQKILFYAGVHDCFSTASGQTKTSGNFIMAVYEALKRSYEFLTPDQWEKRKLKLTPYEENSEHLKNSLLVGR